MSLGGWVSGQVGYLIIILLYVSGGVGKWEVGLLLYVSGGGGWVSGQVGLLLYVFGGVGKWEVGYLIITLLYVSGGGGSVYAIFQYCVTSLLIGKLVSVVLWLCSPGVYSSQPDM